LLRRHRAPCRSNLPAFPFLVIVDLTRLRVNSEYVSSTDRRNVKNEMEEMWKSFYFSGISLEKLKKKQSQFQ
jgi:hypothetical protein